MVPQPEPVFSTSSSPESSNLPSSDSHPSVYSLQSHYTETGEGTEVSDGDSPPAENLSNEEEKGNNSIGGKKAPEIFVDEGEDEVETGTLQDEYRAKPSYPPPKKPLTPYQLARIAGTFGIVVPSLPHPPPTPVSSAPCEVSLSPSTSQIERQSPLRSSYHAQRHSPFLLSVIPPLMLLPTAAVALTPLEIRKRERKWRRGTLMPLQPTLGGMLLCIAREYGLPSTSGIHVYLVLNSLGSLPRSSDPPTFSDRGEESDDEPDGPRVSSQTWSTLFSTYLVQSSAASNTSRAPTPYQTPVKNGEREVPFFTSPLGQRGNFAKAAPKGHKQSLSLSTLAPVSHKTGHSMDSTVTDIPLASTPLMPLTPSTPSMSPFTNPIVGTIEFDIDLEEATWYESWKKKGGGRRWKKSLREEEALESGKKELGLVKKMEATENEQEQKPQFLKELEAARVPSPAPSNEPVSEYMFLEEDESQSTSTGQESDTVLEHDAEISNVVKLLDAQGVKREDLLQSPIQLGWSNERSPDIGPSPVVRRVQEVLDKRWSGLVMSEQLDDLEKIMRRLSPREIHLTSPRYMTPRTAQRIASHDINEDLPKMSNARDLGRSPLAPVAELRTPSMDVNSDSGSDYGDEETHETYETRESMSSRDEEMEDGRPTPQNRQDAWPTLPRHSPASLNDSNLSSFFHHPNFSAPRTNQSPSSETLKRMEEANEPSKPAESREWVPRRPARPPSPRLEQNGTLSHALPDEYVDILKSPRSPPPTGRASPSTRSFMSPGQEDGRKRSGVGALKGLRHQMSAVNLKWRSESSQGQMTSPAAPSGAGLTSPAEFGILSEDADHLSPENESRSSSLPLPPKVASKFASRILHPTFAFRRNEDSSSSKPGHGRRHPSHDGPIQISEISSPIPSTFRHTRSGSLASTLPESAILPSHSIQAVHSRQGSLPHATPRQPSHFPHQPQTPTTPASPASPRSVRRKPVPSMSNSGSTTKDATLSVNMGGPGEGIKSSLSLGSVASFVLEDPPKGKRGLGLAM